jgi:hypothetical protein
MYIYNTHCHGVSRFLKPYARRPAISCLIASICFLMPSNKSTKIPASSCLIARNHVKHNTGVKFYLFKLGCRSLEIRYITSFKITWITLQSHIHGLLGNLTLLAKQKTLYCLLFYYIYCC